MELKPLMVDIQIKHRMGMKLSVNDESSVLSPPTECDSVNVIAD